MNEDRHIIIPIDLHGISHDTLETLVRIASLLDRGLVALLLEDVRLQQAADLSFTTEITLTGARERSLLRDYLSQRQNRVMSVTRHELTDLAKFSGVELRFENATGCRSHSLLDRNGHLDLLFPARQRWQLQSSSFSAANLAISRLGIVLPPTGQAGDVLEVTSLLLNAGLVGELYILSGHLPQPEQLQKLYGTGRRICVQSNLDITPLTVSRLIRQSSYDLLLLPRSCLAEISPAILDDALEKSGSLVLVIS